VAITAGTGFDRVGQILHVGSAYAPLHAKKPEDHGETEHLHPRSLIGN
jgi:hypothetical protein